MELKIIAKKKINCLDKNKNKQIAHKIDEDLWNKTSNEIMNSINFNN